MDAVIRHFCDFFFRFRLVVLLMLGAVIFQACSSEEQSPTPPPKTEEGFTFFDVGAETRFSDSLRDRLRKRLNPDAIEYRSIINLDFNRKGFLKSHFPALHELNRRLNTPSGERVEHNTIKLMYRYAARKNLPFDYVEILFSNYTQKPLYIYIRSRKDLSETIRTLQSKYGPYETIDWDDGQARTHFWEKQQDIFMASILTTRLGEREFRLIIYYVDNSEELILTEEEERRQREEQRQKAGQKAF
jgi:hypothetical protein